jgi:hypothetical protein
MHLSPTPDQKAKEVWKLMDEDMRAFVKSLVDVGLMDGRAGLAKCRVAVFPDRLEWEKGVQPCIETKEERAIKARGARK